MKTCPVCATEYRDEVRFCPSDGQTLRSSGPTQDLVGQVLADRYHILKKLGEGGMGVVYRARDLASEPHVARRDPREWSELPALVVLVAALDLPVAHPEQV